MNELLLCPECNEWQIMPDEKYCSNCGEKVISFELYLQEKIIYTDIKDEENLILTIKNTGFQEITIKKIDSLASWISIEGGKDVKISPTTEHNVTVNLRLQEVRKGSAHKDVTVGKIKVEADEIKEIDIEIFTKPEFILIPKFFMLQVKKSGDISKELKISLKLKRGALNIEEIASDQEWLSAINFDKKNHWLKKGDSIPPITANVNLQALDQPQKGKLKFKLKGIEDWLEFEEFEVSREILPELSIISENTLAIREGKKREYSLQVKNNGGGELHLKDIKINEGVDWFRQKTNLPLQLQENEAKKIDFSVDAANLKVDNTYDVILTIHSNCCLLPIKEFRLSITIEKMESYEYCVAIDFGTTNSCCAYYDEEKKEIALIPLDIAFKEDPYLLPSLIIYKGIDGKYVDYDVGHDAETVRLGKYSANFVESIKRKLGQEEKRPFKLDNRVELLAPWQIARDIIRYMLDKVEEHLDDKKIENCVICHPGRFSAIQINDLRKILKDIGIEECLLIDEASAAAMEYIHQRHKDKNGTSDNYTLVVFDFGGGTTDITLVRVAVEGETDKKYIKIETLDVDGERKLGGDDVTQFIIDLIVEKYIAKLPKESDLGNGPFSIPYVKKGEVFESSNNEDMDKARRGNKESLNSAEVIKIRLTEGDIADYTFQFSVKVEGRDKMAWGPSLPIEVTREELNAKIHNPIRKAIDKIRNMVDEAELKRPDVIVLAGRSSKMPLVEELMKKEFGESEIIYAKELKECVAKGACQYGITQIFSGGVSFQIGDFANKTHSRFGIETLDEYNQLRFREIIGKRLKIPEQSMGRINERLKRKTVIPVVEHLGIDNALSSEEIETVDVYTAKFPPEITDEDLRNGSIEMRMDKDESIKVIAKVKDKEFPFSSKRTVRY